MTLNEACGTAYLRSFRPLGYQSRDMGLFKDDDGTGYLLTEDVHSLCPRVLYRWLITVLA